MVASASSSNTQWPSGCWSASSAAGRGLDAAGRATACPEPAAAVYRARGRSSPRPSTPQGPSLSAISIIVHRPLRRRGCRNGSRPRWSPAIRSASNRRPETDCARRSAAPGRLAFSIGVAAKVARRSRTICHGGSGAASPGHGATSRQIVCGEFFTRRRRRSRSAALMVTESRPLKAKIHSVVPFTTPITAGATPAADRWRKCSVDDGAKSRWAPAGPAPVTVASTGPGPRGSRMASRTDVDVSRRRNRAPSRAGRKSGCACSSWPNRISPPRVFQVAAMAGSINAALRPSRATSGRQACAAGEQRFAHDRAGEGGRPASRGSVLRAASSSGCSQPVIKWSRAVDHVAKRPSRRGRPQQRREFQIVGKPRFRGTRSPLFEHPQRQPAVIDPQCPALAALEIGERKLGAVSVRPGCRPSRSCARNAARRDCRQQQMIAVVDQHVRSPGS